MNAYLGQLGQRQADAAWDVAQFAIDLVRLPHVDNDWSLVLWI
jgi:hypothetical protein